MQKADGMFYAPKGRAAPVCKPEEFPIAAVGLDHGLGLVRLAELAGGEVMGVGALIEKHFEGGRAALEEKGFVVKSLACVASMDKDEITFTNGY